MVGRAGKRVVQVDFSQLGIDASRLKRYFDFAPPVVVTKISGRIRNRVSPIRIPEPYAVESVELRETVGRIEGTAKTLSGGVFGGFPLTAEAALSEFWAGVWPSP